MRYTFVHKHNSASLLLFFNGWGMDENSIKHVDNELFDVIEIHDYSNLQLDIPELHMYSRKYLVAWSMGVWAASWWMSRSGVTIEKTVAINGTMFPIDTCRGIDPALFQATIDNWDERGRQRFMSRMFASAALFNQHKDTSPARNLLDQKHELQELQSSVCDIKHVCWNKAIIGSDDLIFLPQNQHAAWEHTTGVESLKMPHYPFLEFTNWNDVLA